MTAGKGKCLCGAVRVTAQSIKTHHHACHCGSCRKWGSSPYFSVPSQGVSFEGEENITRYDSSEWAERGFCKICGSSLFYRLKNPETYYISVGIFDEPTDFTLVGEIFIDSKPDGYNFAGDHPRKTEAEVIAEFSSSD